MELNKIDISNMDLSKNIDGWELENLIERGAIIIEDVTNHNKFILYVDTGTLRIAPIE